MMYFSVKGCSPSSGRLSKRKAGANPEEMLSILATNACPPFLYSLNLSFGYRFKPRNSYFFNERTLRIVRAPLRGERTVTLKRIRSQCE